MLAHSGKRGFKKARLLLRLLFRALQEHLLWLCAWLYLAQAVSFPALSLVCEVHFMVPQLPWIRDDPLPPESWPLCPLQEPLADPRQGGKGETFLLWFSSEPWPGRAVRRRDGLPQLLAHLRGAVNLKCILFNGAGKEMNLAGRVAGGRCFCLDVAAAPAFSPRSHPTFLLLCPS